MDGDAGQRCAEEAILNDLCPHNSSTHEASQVNDRDEKEELHVRFKDTALHQNVDSKYDAEEVSNDEELDSRSDDPKDVSIWRVFKYASTWDVLLMIFGTVMAVAAGIALPGHLFLVGSVLNEFVYHSVVTSNNLEIPLDSLPPNVSCEDYQSLQHNSRPMSSTSLPGDRGSGYFCSNSTSGSDVIENLVPYLCDPDATLRSEIGLYSLYYIALATGVLITVFLATTFWNLSAFHQVHKMRKDLYHSILRQNIGWFDEVETGEISTTLVDDIDKIQSGIGDKMAIFLQYFTTFVTAFIIAYFVNWKLALVVSVTLPVVIAMGVLLTKVVQSFTRREQEAYGAAGAIAEEVLSSIRTVVAFGGEGKETERYDKKIKLTRNESFKKYFFSSLITGGFYFVVFAAYGVSLWYGSVLIIGCEVSAGDVTIVLLSVLSGSFALQRALPSLEAFATAIGSATAVFEIIDRKSEIDWSVNEGATPDNMEGNIEFSKVEFAYPTRPDVQIFDGLDLKITAGQTVALVGPSGCGKSTIIQLIQRFYNPLGGLITIDGRDISSYNLQWLRSHVGVVSQEPVLFSGTIADNIRLGRQGASIDDIIEAAKNSNAHDFISQMPEGYDTHIGQKGAQLSGGQKQRIAIARALIRNPKILLLDEATSALDNQSEKVVQDALDKAREGRTTIVVAHRLSTIQSADVIVAISEGLVEELGSHRELMEKKGLYHELVMAQTVDDGGEEQKLNPPLARFRAAVNKSIEARRQTLAKFRAAVHESLAKSKQGKSRRSSRRSIRRGSTRRRMVRQSSQVSFTSLESGPFSTHTAYLSSVETISEDAKTDHEKEDVSSKVKDEPKSHGIIEMLKLNKPDWLVVLVGVIFSSLLGSLFPIMAVLLSEVFRIYGLNDPEAIRSGIAKVAAGYFGAAVGVYLLYFVANFSLSVAGECLTKRLRYRSFKSMLRQEIAWFDQKSHSIGALLTILASDTSDVKGATGLVLGIIFQAIFSVITAIVIILVSSWELALVIISSLVVTLFANYLQIRVLASTTLKNKRELEESVQMAVESIDHISTVAGLGLEEYFHTKYSSLLQGPFKMNIRSVFITSIMLAIGQSVLFYVYSACYSLSAFLVAEDRAVYYEIFRVLSTIYFTSISVAQVSTVAPNLSKAKVSASRILSLIQRKTSIDAESDEGLKLDEVTGNVAAKLVHFSYPSRLKVKVLQGLSVEVKAGQTLALVGPSGCGKSTLVSLVERFYDPTSGHVTLEGRDLKELNLPWLRQQVGIVPQEPTLFGTTIADNIRYGALFREVSDDEVIEVAKSANIHNFIESLPKGYATTVGSKGTQLSGGQKQRIAIARALVRNPKILLLDEATSALDTESEKVVQEALDKARQGRTSIVIAHRLSTIYNSDVIAVIHEGEVIESGTHSELIDLKEAYYHLNTVQEEA